jgi:flagellin
MAEVSLTPAIRTGLEATRVAGNNAADAANRLSLGRAILSALDGAQAFSDSVNLDQRAQDLLGVKAGIDIGISALRAANEGLSSIERFLEQAKSVAQRFEATDSAEEQARLQQIFDTLTQQIDNLAGDTSFLGRNLIDSAQGTLNVRLDEDGGSDLTVEGRASDSASLGLALDVDTIDAAIAQVRASQSALGFDTTVLQVREGFTENLSRTLEDAASRLVEADANEQAAIAISSQARQQLATQGLSLTAQSERSIAGLF